MLAIDTKLVVHFLVKDEPGPAAKVASLIDQERVLIARTVILETVRSAYAMTSGAIIDALLALAGLPNVVIEDAPLVMAALASAKAGMDFADALHLAAAQGCTGFVTVDRHTLKAGAPRSGRVPVRSL